MFQRNIIRNVVTGSIIGKHSNLILFRALSRSRSISQKQEENRLNDFIKKQESLRGKSNDGKNGYNTNMKGKNMKSIHIKKLSPEIQSSDTDYKVDVEDLSNRWEKMTPDDKQDILNYLDVKQSFAWSHLSEDEKKAIYYISFGKWGPRNHPPMTVPEMVFKALVSLFLFTAFGFAMINYRKDKKKVKELEGESKKVEKLDASSPDEVSDK